METDADVPVKVGDIVADKYRVEKVLGVGAMGVVVAAMHVDLQERRAIKFMRSSMLGDTEGVERFLREARAAVRLKSQHVAKVQDVGRLGTGAPYIVMEYLDGSDLKTLLEARGTLPVSEAVDYLLQTCEAIAEAHNFGIIHRDLKPANLFLTTGVNGTPMVKVLDFGIAKVMGPAGPARQLTAMDQILGTPLYMSPEQILKSTRTVDTRTDIWALGVILYRMLTGRTPFSGGNVTEICAAVMGDQPDPPTKLRPDVPPPVEAAVMRCLEKSAARRFGTATELAAALAPFASASGRTGAPPASGRFAPPVAAPQPQATVVGFPQAPASSQQRMQTPPVQQEPMQQEPMLRLPKRTEPLPQKFMQQAPMPQGSPPAVATPAPSSSKTGLAVAAIAVVVLIGGGAVLALKIRGSGAAPASPAATATAAAPR